MLNFRVYGKSGQGVHKLTKLIGKSCFLSGMSVKDFVLISQERCGMPVVGSVATSKEDILSNDFPEPDYVLIMDNTLNMQEISKNMNKNTIVILNSKDKKINPAIQKTKAKVHAVDATKIAMEFLRKNTPSTTMLGALIKYCNKLTLKNAKIAVETEIGEKIKENLECLEQGNKSAR